jgi:hypothetical protein
MATYTTPRTPGAPPQTPGRGTPPRRGTPPGRGTPAGRGTPPGRKTPDGRGARPVRAPRHTRPLTGPGTKPAARPALGRTRPRRPRAPFILLLVGLLGGALVCLLVISTTLAEGAYRITNLQQQDANLAKQEQLLTQQVAQASSPTQIAQEAEQFGMRPNPALQFINLKTGKVVSGKVSSADAAINVPGYTP